jgi:hypothetical protein
MIAAAILTLCGLAYTVLYAAIRYRPYRMDKTPAVVATAANIGAVAALALAEEGCYSRPAIGASIAVADLVFLTTPRGGGTITSLVSYVSLVFTFTQIYRCI